MTKKEFWDLLTEQEKVFMRELSDKFDIKLVHCEANETCRDWLRNRNGKFGRLIR